MIPAPAAVEKNIRIVMEMSLKLNSKRLIILDKIFNPFI
jgi:hypothetical protein